MCLPAEMRLWQQHGELVGEAECHHGADKHVNTPPVEDPAYHDIAEITEDYPTCPGLDGIRASEEPGRESAGQDDYDCDRGELAQAPVRGQETEDEQRPRVALDVTPAEVQERGSQYVGQRSDVARLDTVAVGQLVAVGDVHDLDDPQQGQDADHHEEGPAGVAEQRLSFLLAQRPSPAPWPAR